MDNVSDQATIMEAIAVALTSKRRYDQKIPLTIERGEDDQVVITRWTEPVMHVRTLRERDGMLEDMQVIVVNRRGEIFEINSRQQLGTDGETVIWRTSEVLRRTPASILSWITAADFVAGIMATVEEAKRRAVDRLDDINKRWLALRHLREHGPNDQFLQEAKRVGAKPIRQG